MHQGKALRTYLKAKDIAVEEFMVQVNKSRRTVYEWFKLSELPEDVLYKIIHNAKVPEHIFKTDNKPNFYDTPRAPSKMAEGMEEYKKKVPFYDVDFAASEVELFNDIPERVTSYIYAPGMEDCDFSVPIWGHSMYPTFENGTIVGMKHIKDKSIIVFGECYGVRTREYRLVKRIIKSENEGYIILYSDNNEKLSTGQKKYSDIEIHKDTILDLWIIKGVFKRIH